MKEDKGGRKGRSSVDREKAVFNGASSWEGSALRAQIVSNSKSRISHCVSWIATFRFVVIRTKDQNFSFNTMQRPGGSVYLHRLVELLRRNYVQRIVHALLWRLLSHSAFQEKDWRQLRISKCIVVQLSSRGGRRRSLMQHWGQIWYHYRASITGTFVFYRNSTSRNLYHDNSSSKNDKKYILRTSVHRRHGGHWMSTIAPAGNYITKWSRHLSCLSILNHSILHLSIHSNSNPHKQVKAIRYAIAVFSFSPPQDLCSPR